MSSKKPIKITVKKEIKTEVDKICISIANSQNIEFVESTWINEMRGMVLTAYIYKEDGVSLDDCELFHKALQAKIENYDYDYLEVSSLGADRPIKSFDDFKRHAGEVVDVKLFAKESGSKSFVGSIIDYNDQGIIIENSQNQTLVFKHNNIAVIKPIIDVEAEVEAVDLENDNNNI